MYGAQSCLRRAELTCAPPVLNPPGFDLILRAEQAHPPLRPVLSCPRPSRVPAESVLLLYLREARALVPHSRDARGGPHQRICAVGDPAPAPRVSPPADRPFQVMVRGHCGPWRTGVGSPNWAGEGALGNALAASADAGTKPCTLQKTPNSAPSAIRSFWKPFPNPVCSERDTGIYAGLDEGALGFRLSRQKWALARGSAARVGDPEARYPEMSLAVPGGPQLRPGRLLPWTS